MTIQVLQPVAETHDVHDYPEGFIVTGGEVHLLVNGKAIAVNEGGMYIVPPGAVHSVAHGSNGTLVVFQ